jgi:hypothetical protein
MNRPDFIVRGTISDSTDEGKIYYIAAAPPDYRATFTGSALPFANPQQAFFNTPNFGEMQVSLGSQFQIPIRYPNAFYDDLGNIYVPPTLFIMYKRNGQEIRKSIKVGSGVPYRLLDHPNMPPIERKNVSFYDVADLMTVRTQEQILRESGFPEKNKMQNRFWGTRPPL